MILYRKALIINGMRVIIHRDRNTPLVAMSMLYSAGSKYENPEHTGIAHLMEHMMFSGTDNIEDFDEPIQVAGGENNAFTNSDIAQYYNIVPSNNIETLLWLESDRMYNLDLNIDNLENQKKVVSEEFYETCLNQPYGDSWHHLSEMAYENTHYEWPTIGKNIEHIQQITHQEILEFYKMRYSAHNAVLSIAGNIEYDHIIKLIEKWFGFSHNPKLNLPNTSKPHHLKNLPSGGKRKVISAKVPSPAIFIAFHMCHRLHDDYHTMDLISDILSNGRSSRLFKSLYKGNKLVSSVDAYITGTEDSGLFILEAKPEAGINISQIESALWDELNKLKTTLISSTELKKWIHKMNAGILYSETDIMSKALNLAYYEHIGNLDLINLELERYRAITPEKIKLLSQETFLKDNSFTIIYQPIN